jgi:hypothetical protein
LIAAGRRWWLWSAGMAVQRFRRFRRRHCRLQRRASIVVLPLPISATTRSRNTSLTELPMT